MGDAGDAPVAVGREADALPRLGAAHGRLEDLLARKRDRDGSTEFARGEGRGDASGEMPSFEPKPPPT